MVKEPESGYLQGVQDGSGTSQVCKDGKCPNKNMKNKDMLFDIIDRLARIEEKVSVIQSHTKTMNGELGKCKDRIAKIENSFFMKLSWKQVTAIATLVSIIMGIVTQVV